MKLTWKYGIYELMHMVKMGVIRNKITLSFQH